MIHAVIPWLWHPLGQCVHATQAELIRCRSYNFWSGIGSDFGEILLLGIFITMYRHFVCHVNAPHYCFRFGHPVPSTSFRACKRHHPSKHRQPKGQITSAHIQDAYKEARDE